jgi:hypothetical protein
VNAIRGFVKLGTLVGALTNEGKLVLCFPLDNLCWTKALGKLSGGIEAAVDKFKPAAVELWVTGTVSARAKQALSERKWVVREGAGQELLGEKM